MEKSSAFDALQEIKAMLREAQGSSLKARRGKPVVLTVAETDDDPEAAEDDGAKSSKLESLKAALDAAKDCESDDPAESEEEDDDGPPKISVMGMVHKSRNAQRK